jgi:adenosylcobinamide-GDP ribazoletransferase
MGAVRRAADGAALAVAFLTIAPVPTSTRPEGIGTVAAWFPAVGALVGLAAGGVRLAADSPLGSGVAAALATIVLVAVTGALHQDALADCADALGVRGDRTRRLAVMRDPSTGAFGTIALVLWTVLLFAALAELPRREAIPALVLAAGVGRWAAVLHGILLAPARRDGLGAAFGVGAGSFAAASATTLVLVLLLSPARGAVALLAAIVVTLALTAWARRALGGRTGDTLGATVALVEVTVCLVVLAFARG